MELKYGRKISDYEGVDDKTIIILTIILIRKRNTIKTAKAILFFDFLDEYAAGIY